jgi:hypothetical protein
MTRVVAPIIEQTEILVPEFVAPAFREQAERETKWARQDEELEAAYAKGAAERAALETKREADRQKLEAAREAAWALAWSRNLLK